MCAYTIYRFFMQLSFCSGRLSRRTTELRSGTDCFNVYKCRGDIDVCRLFTKMYSYVKLAQCCSVGNFLILSIHAFCFSVVSSRPIEHCFSQNVIVFHFSIAIPSSDFIISPKIPIAHGSVSYRMYELTIFSPTRN